MQQPVSRGHLDTLRTMEPSSYQASMASCTWQVRPNLRPKQGKQGGGCWELHGSHLGRPLEGKDCPLGMHPLWCESAEDLILGGPWEVKQVEGLTSEVGMRVQPENNGHFETSRPMLQAEAKLEPGASHGPPTERVAIFRTIFSDILCIWDQPIPLLVLLPINHELQDSSELLRQSKGPHNTPGQHASAAISTMTNRVALEGALSQDVQKPSQDEGGIPWILGSHQGLGEDLTLGLLDLHSPGSADFLESHFLSKEVKLIKKVATTRLTSAGCLPLPLLPAGWREYLFERLTLKHI
ncbi:hypothetical protein GH733_018435 [Mirounga leonina]|nr:hypothetical protein GH733_018435 [Mirounga leonina]